MATWKIRRIVDKDGMEPCLAAQCAEDTRKQRGLPKGSPVPVWVSCPCPRCTPRYV